MDPAIGTSALHFARRRGRTPIDVLGGVNLAVAPGEAVGLMGRSGVGKSTLIAILAGYLRPTAGIVLERGVPVSGPGSSRLVVFQGGSLWPWLSLSKNVMLGLARERHDRTRLLAMEAMLERLGIADARDAFPAELSGGMQKRAELARALLARPRVLMLDEALGSVDPVTKQVCIDSIADFRKETDAAVIVVSHDIDEVVRLTERVIVLAGQPAQATRAIDVSARDGNDRERVHAEILAAMGYRK